MTTTTVEFRNADLRDFITAADMVAVPRAGETVRLPLPDNKWGTYTVVGVHHHVSRQDTISPTRSLGVICFVELNPE